MDNPIEIAKRMEETAKQSRIDIREYNRRVMPCALDFMREIVPSIEKHFGKVQVTDIRCNGYVWERGKNNDRAYKEN